MKDDCASLLRRHNVAESQSSSASEKFVRDLRLDSELMRGLAKQATFT